MPKVKTIQELKKELQTKEAALTRLSAQRNRLAVRLAAIDRKIATLEGDAPKPGKKRGPKPGKKRGPKPGKKTADKAGKKTTRRRTRRGAGKSLNDFIGKVLGGAEAGMRPKDIMAAVRKAGYKTKSRDFYGLVAAALRDDTKFQRVSRGVYKNK